MQLQSQAILDIRNVQRRVIWTDKMDPDKSRNSHFAQLAYTQIYTFHFYHYDKGLINRYIYLNTHALGKTIAILGSNIKL